MNPFENPSTHISSEELKLCLKQVILVDVRQPEEHSQSAIPGSKLLPLDILQSTAEQELSKDAPIVLYCAHGVRSQHALLTLRSLGFKHLKSLVGGISAWKEQNGPTHTPR